MSRRGVRRRRVQPDNINGQLTLRTDFYKTELYRKVRGIFDVTLPDDWDYNYFMENFILRGLITICDSVIGLKAFRCSTFGVNYMNNPTNVNIAVPTIMSFQKTIDVDCTLIYVDRLPDRVYYSFVPLINVYAEKLASADCAIDVNMMNSRLAYAAEAETKAQADTIKEMYDRVSIGEPLVVYRGGSVGGDGLKLFFNNVKNNYIVNDVQDSKRTIINELLTTLGVNNANTDKKERLITPEVESNYDELLCNTEVWSKNLELQVGKTHKLFPELKDTFDIKLQYRDKIIQSFMQLAEGGGQNETKRDDATVDNKESR